MKQTEAEIRDLIRSETRTFFNTILESRFRKIEAELKTLKSDLKEAILVPYKNEIFFDDIKNYLRHIRDLEKKLYDEYLHLRSELYE